MLILIACLPAMPTAAEPHSTNSAASGISSPLIVSATASFLPLRGHLAYYLDDGKQLDITAIRKLPDSAFEPLAGNANIGYRDTVLWLRMILQRSADAPECWWLEIEPAYLDRVSLFPARAGEAESREIAIARNWSQRDLPSRSALFAIDMAGRQQQTFFLRVENATALQATPILWQPAAYQQHNIQMALLHGGVFVSALVIILINLFYWGSIRQTVFLWYIAFVGSSAFVLMQTEGYLLLLFQPEASFADKIVLSLSQLIAILSFYGLFTVFVQPWRYWPRTCWVVRVLSCVMAVSVLLLLLGRKTGMAMQVEWGAVLCLFVTTLLCGLYLAMRGDRRARRYLLCFSVLILLLILRAVELFGLVSLSLDFSSLFAVACLIHWVLLQLVVIDEINSIRRAHAAARDQALAKSLAMEKELEKRVVQRTSELEQVGQQLRLALEDEKETNVAHHQFLRLVSHEFSTPLSVIAGSAEMLNSRGDDPQLRERIIRRIQSSTAKMNELVERALEIDRTEGAVWRANARDVRLDTLIAEVVQNCLHLGQQTERLQITCPALELRADPELLGIALQNLLLNALKYSPAHSPVEIRVEQDADGIRIHVRDQGRGISPAQQKAIFGKYYRRHHGEPGLGLGLYLVDHIMRLHGGRVDLVSTLGQGSCFILHLPPIYTIPVD